MSQPPGGDALPGPLRLLGRGAAVLVFVLLVVALGLKISSNADKQLIRLGEWIWPGYANELRMDPERPECDLEEIDATIASCPPPGEEGAGGSEGTGKKKKGVRVR